MKRAVLASLALLAAACAPPETCSGSSPILGTWRYSATQESPSHSTITGTLQVSTVSCGALSGELDVVETPAFGPARRLAGPVSGTVLDATSIRFDAVFDAGSRQHLAKLAGDSLAGTWVSVDGAQAASGSFGGRRQ